MTFLLTIGTTQLSFILDNEQLPDEFTFQQDVPYFVYNATVYSNTSVNSAGTGPNGLHNLTISSVFDMTFDFAIYTYVIEISLLNIRLTVRSISDSDNASQSTSFSTTSSTIIALASESTQAQVLDSHASLSGGTIAGICIGAVAGVVCLVIVIWRLAWSTSHGRWPLSKQRSNVLNSESCHNSRVLSPFTARPTGQMPPVPSMKSSTPLSSEDQRAIVSPPSTNAQGQSFMISPSSTGIISHDPPSDATSSRPAISALMTQLARLEAQSQAQSTSTVALQAQIAILEARLRSASTPSEPPPEY